MVKVRSMRTPAVSIGTRTIDCCSCLGASGFVLPRTIATLQRGWAALVHHHLLPLMTYSEPFRSLRVRMFDASDDATSGSVIAKQERISPERRGASHRFFCASVPCWSDDGMFP